MSWGVHRAALSTPNSFRLFFLFFPSFGGLRFYVVSA